MQNIVYIAGPYAASSDEERTENVRRIGEVARFALSLGFAPITVHAAIEAGHYGDDSDPEARARGLDATCEIAGRIALSGGHFFAIRRDDGSLSDGTKREHDAVLKSGAQKTAMICLTWNEWKGAQSDGGRWISRFIGCLDRATVFYGR